MKIFNVTYSVEKGLPFNGREAFHIDKSLFFFGKKIFSDRFIDFYDKSDGPIPFMTKEDASHRCRIMRMLETENKYPFITDKYFIGDDFDAKNFCVYKERYVFGISLVLSEEVVCETFGEACEVLNNILDEKYVR